MDFQRLINFLGCSMVSRNTDSSRFLSSLFFTLKIEEDRDHDGLCWTDGVSLHLNPDRFVKVSPAQAVAELVHCLWHVARMHAFRGAGKNQKIWNLACDIVIDNSMEEVGDKFRSYACQEYKGYGEELLYNLLLKEEPEGERAGNDLKINDSRTSSYTAQSVITEALQAAGSSSNSAVMDILKRFTRSSMNWQDILRRALNDLVRNPEASWSRPSRRYQDMYLPSYPQKSPTLPATAVFIDVSGSVRDNQIKEFVNETACICKTFNPDKLFVRYFDTRILHTEEVKKDTISLELPAYRGAGTSYESVARSIEDNKDRVAIIFTDLMAPPMRKLKRPCHVFWIAAGIEAIPSNAPAGTVLFNGDSYAKHLQTN